MLKSVANECIDVPNRGKLHSMMMVYEQPIVSRFINIELSKVNYKLELIRSLQTMLLNSL